MRRRVGASGEAGEGPSPWAGGGMAVGGRAGQSLRPCPQPGGAGVRAGAPRTARQARAAGPGGRAGREENGAGPRGGPGLPPARRGTSRRHGRVAAPGGSGAERGHFCSFRVACSRCSLQDSLPTGCCCDGSMQGLVSQALCTARPGRRPPGGGGGGPQAGCGNKTSTAAPVFGVWSAGESRSEGLPQVEARGFPEGRLIGGSLAFRCHSLLT